jgi:hypothetical protein
MACYISSNNNRFFVALEAVYGNVPAIAGANRIPAVKLAARQVPVDTGRRDKTGSRTFAGLPNGIRKLTNFKLNTFLTQWSDMTAAPSEGPLFQAALGAAPVFFNGGTVASVTGQTQVQFAAAHGLTIGQAVTFGGEIRFVTTILNSTTVFLNAPFSAPPTVGAEFGTTITYKLATDLPSVSIFDFWDPATVVQRILDGSAVDKMRVIVDGDFHEFEFAGPARDLLDSASFTSGEGGLTQFPAEPLSVGFDYTIVPGHLGQVWMGASPAKFCTLTAAELLLDNNIELRMREFGCDVPKCIAAGGRTVTLNFEIFEQDDVKTKELYQAARQRSPISVMFQLGQQAGQLFGAYMPAMVPEVPEFDDSETRLQWKFSNNRAQGSVDDELYIAFG